MNLSASWHWEYLLSGLLLLLLFAPVVIFLLDGWTVRQREILGAFPEGPARCYLRTFFAAARKQGEPARTAFEENYRRRFGRQHFAFPGLCLLGISAAAIFLAIRTLSSWAQGGSETVPFQVAAAAVAGAYMWVCYDLTRRAQQRDLRPIHLLWAAFRFVVAVPLGLAFSALLKENAGVPIAFMLGAFPTRTLFTFTRRTTMSKLGLGEQDTESGCELAALQGIGRSTAERFEDEGVITILQLAYSDPVDLAIRTNLCFSYVVDCCSQALAWLYLQDDLTQLRQFGLRGGQEICSLLDDMDAGAGDPCTELARKTLELAAQKLKVPHQGLEYALRQIAGDPYTQFLCHVWQRSE